MNRNRQIDIVLEALRAGRNQEAASAANALLARFPDDAEGHSLRGLALIDTFGPEGFAALRKAIELEPGQPRWHMHLGVGAARSRRWAEAEAAFGKAVSLSRTTESLQAWADALQKFGRHAEALAALREAVEKKPSKLGFNRIAVSQEALGDTIGAMKTRRHAISIGKATPGDLYELGRLQEATLRYRAARGTFDALVKMAPKVPDVVIPAARLARIGGDDEKARSLVAHARTEHPDHPGLVLEALAAGDPPAEALAKAEALAADAKSRDRQAAAFALAAWNDRKRDEEKAWHFATIGNGLYREPGRSVADEERTVEQAISLYGQIPQGDPGGGPRPVYLLGPPRSGGSLLQTVLAAPDGHASLGERGALMPWLLKAAEEGESLWQREAASLRASDIAGMEGLAEGASVVVDKTTSHVHLAGLIQRLHPGAVFIDQRRDLRDVLVSIYLHGFKPVFGWARTVEDIAGYLVFQRDTVGRWKEAGVPIEVHDHEAFIRDPEAVGQQLFGRLGFDWSADCLGERRAGSDIRTFSIDRARGAITPAYSGKASRYQGLVGALPERFEALARG